VAFSAVQGLTQRIRAVATASAVAPERFASTLQTLAPAMIGATVAIAVPALWICLP
jgi:hypothetical protein